MTAPAMDLHWRRRHTLLMRLSFRSRLAISCSFCYAFRAACRLSAVALFRLKIASSGRGTLARTRCAHLNCNDKRTEDSVSVKGPQKDQHHNKKHRSTKTHREDDDLPISQTPRGGASGTVAPAVTRRMPSRSPVPHDAGSPAAMGGSGQLRSSSRGPDRPTSHGDKATAFGAAHLFGHGTAQGCRTR
jgi:hypothetical protein